jgi:hypothetical protein
MKNPFNISLPPRTENGVIATAYSNGIKVVVVAHTTYWDNEFPLSIYIDGRHYKIDNVGRETSLTFVNS